MAQYINKDALVAEIKKGIERYKNEPSFPSISYEISYIQYGKLRELEEILLIVNNLEAVELGDKEQPDHSYSETIYHCGRKPYWKVGDILAYYEFYSDREGECVLGKVTKVEFDEEQCDWFYTFEDGSVYDEQSLLKEETYKKN